MRAWEGFLEEALQLGFKEDRDKEVEEKHVSGRCRSLS